MSALKSWFFLISLVMLCVAAVIHFSASRFAILGYYKLQLIKKILFLSSCLGLLVYAWYRSDLLLFWGLILFVFLVRDQGTETMGRKT